MLLKKLLTRNEAFEETTTEVKTFWDMARIKTMEVKACKKKTHQFVGRWRHLQKSKTRVAGGRHEKFRENLDKLWDIDASDAIEQIQKKKQTTVLR